MKIIVLMPVKNEEWILEKTLKAASLFADHIIVADQNSTDRTLEICKKFKKVEVLVNKNLGLHQSKARQVLLDKARDYGGNNILIALDADELFTANCLDDKTFWSSVKALKPGQSVMLQWIMLWRSSNEYREDNSIWSNSWKHFIFRDDGISSFSDKPTSEPRMPEKFTKSYIRYKNVKVLHYQFVDWERMLAKQRRYRIYDYLNQPTFFNALKVNQRYYFTKDERHCRLKKIMPVWTDKWIKHNINFNFNSGKDFYWYDEDILKFLKKYKAKRFKWLDIWDIDWEKKRQVAIKRIVKELSEDRIKDPRLFYIKFYHKRLQRLLNHNNFIYKFLLFFKQKWQRIKK